MAGKVGRSLPGLAQGTGNALSAAMYAGSQVLGTVEGATVDAIPKVRQETGGAFNAAVHAGGTVLGSMEKATVDAMHGAEHMLSDIGEGAKSYMPNVGAYFGGASWMVFPRLFFLILFHSGAEANTGPKRCEGEAAI